MISVVLALYNGENYIISQLESIKNQTVKPDEVLIFDDVSTDNSVNIVKRFIEDNKLQNWEIIKNHRNIGYARNFYKALNMVQGDFVFLADQDDVWKNNKIERMMKDFKRDLSITCVVSGVAFVDNNMNKMKRKHFQCNPVSHYITSEEAIKNCSYMGCSMALKKNALSDYFWKLKDIEAHDWAIMLDMNINGKLYYDGQSLIYHRIHSCNASEIYQGESLKEKRISMLKKMIKHYIWGTRYYNNFNNHEMEKEIIQKYKKFYKKRLKAINSSGVLKKIFLIRYCDLYFSIYKNIRPLLVDIFLEYINCFLLKYKI